MATVFLLDSEPFTRDGIRTYLENGAGYTVVGEDHSGLDALPKIFERRPEVLVTDLNLHGLDGLEVVRRVRDQMPSVRIVVNTRKVGSNFVTRAVNYGASAYVLKNSRRSDLSDAIATVLAGETFFSPVVAHFIDDDGQTVDLYEQLTPREREVLQQVAEGKTAADITNVLYISVRTVEKHRANLMKKLGVKNHADLIRYALQRGLIPFEEARGDLAD